MFKFLRDLMMALIIIKVPSLLTLPPCIGIHNSKRKQSLSSVVKENFFKLLLSKVNCESAGSRGIYFRQCNPNKCTHVTLDPSVIIEITFQFEHPLLQSFSHSQQTTFLPIHLTIAILEILQMMISRLFRKLIQGMHVTLCQDSALMQDNY